jgi:hypothetical protein
MLTPYGVIVFITDTQASSTTIYNAAPVALPVKFKANVTVAEAPNTTCSYNYSVQVQVAQIIEDNYGISVGQTLQVHYLNAHAFLVGAAVEVYGFMVLGTGQCSGSNGVVLVDEGSGPYIEPTIPPSPESIEISPVTKNSCYTVTNQSPGVGNYTHQFYNQSNQIIHTLIDTISASGTKVYKVAEISAISAGYTGRVVIQSNQPSTASLVSCSGAQPPQVQLLSPAAGSTVYQGGNLLVKAMVTRGGQSLLGAKVTGSLELAGPGYLSFTLYDDGNVQNGDSTAGDGIYTASITLYGGTLMPTTLNPYDLAVTATADGLSGSAGAQINVSGHNGAPTINLSINGPSAPDYFAGQQMTITAQLNFPDGANHNDTAVKLAIILPDLSTVQINLTNVGPNTWRNVYTLPAGQKGGAYILDAHAIPTAATGFVDAYSSTNLEVYTAPLILNITTSPGTYSRLTSIPLAACVRAGNSNGPLVSGVEVKAHITTSTPKGSVILGQEKSPGCYETTYYPDTSGAYSLSFEAIRSGYKPATASLSFNVTNNPPSLANALTKYRNQNVSLLDQLGEVTAHIAHDGDWFKAKLIQDKIKLFTDFVIDLSETVVIGLSQEGISENTLIKMKMPGLKVITVNEKALKLIIGTVGQASFDALKTGTDEAVRSMFPKQSFRYYITGGMPDKDMTWPDYMSQEYHTLTSAPNSMTAKFLPSLQSDISAFQTTLQLVSNEIIAALPMLTAEQEEAYLTDLARRQAAIEWLGYEELHYRADLLFETQAKREAMEEEYWREIVTFLGELGLKVGLALSPIGGPLADIAGDAGLTSFHAYVNDKFIEQDQLMRDMALGLIHQAFDLEVLMMTNTFAGLDLLKQGTIPTTPNGAILDVNLVRTTSAIIFTRDVYVDLVIKNTGSTTADFFVKAYFCAKRGPGCYRQILDEMRDPATDQSLQFITLNKDQSKTVRLYFKEAGKADFGTPKYEVFFVLFAVNDQGSYRLDAKYSPYSYGLVTADVNGVTEVDRFPLTPRVGAASDNLVYTLAIAVDNPFPMPLAVSVEQSIPATVQITDSGVGAVSGGKIIWNQIIPAHETIVLGYDFTYSGPYGQEVNLPIVSLSFYDAAANNTLTLNTDPISFQAKIPLRINSNADLSVPPNTQQSISVNVTNMDSLTPQQGDLTLRLQQINGTELYDTTTHVALGANSGQVYNLAYFAPAEGFYLLQVFLNYGGNTTPIISDILTVKHNQSFLPVILKRR